MPALRNGIGEAEMIDSSNTTTAPSSQNLEFQIGGMTCASCVRHVEKAISNVEGVEEAQVSLVNKRATVFSSDSIDPANIVHAVEAAGYSARQVVLPPEQARDADASERG